MGVPRLVLGVLPTLPPARCPGAVGSGPWGVAPDPGGLPARPPVGGVDGVRPWGCAPDPLEGLRPSDPQLAVLLGPPGGVLLEPSGGLCPSDRQGDCAPRTVRRAVLLGPPRAVPLGAPEGCAPRTPGRLSPSDRQEPRAALPGHPARTRPCCSAHCRCLCSSNSAERAGGWAGCPRPLVPHSPTPFNPPPGPQLIQLCRTGGRVGRDPPTTRPALADAAQPTTSASAHPTPANRTGAPPAHEELGRVGPPPPQGPSCHDPTSYSLPPSARPRRSGHLNYPHSPPAST